MTKSKKGSKLTPLDYSFMIGGGLLLVKAIFGSKMKRPEAIQILKVAGHTSPEYADETKFATDYLVAWASAINKHLAQFRLGKFIYDTTTGKRIA